MTLAHQIQADGTVYTVVDDFTSVYRALITGSVTDEILSGPFAGTVVVRVDNSDLTVKVIPNGFFAIAGYVEKAFPKLALTGQTVHIAVSAAGCQDQTITVTIPAGTSIFPVPPLSVAVRRNPITIQGRVVANTASRLPISGANVATVDNPTGPPAPHAIALRSPISLPHAPGATAQEITMTVFGSAVLNSSASSGATVLNLSNVAGLAANSVLQLASGVLTEYTIVSSVGPGAGDVSIRDPLNSTFPSASTTVQFMNPGAVGTVVSLSADAATGDGILSTSDRLNNTIEIDPGTPNVEYRDVGVVTDASGYYGIRGVGRFQELFFEASHVGFTSVTVDWFVEYDNAVNVVDFRL